MDSSSKQFSFGKNWRNFVARALNDERIETARKQTAGFLGVEELRGLTFLDIGCGSGLFSYAAHLLGAKQITSFDLDPFSVQCCEHMRQKAGNPENWQVMPGSILDREFLAKLPPADVVYSWGVLHHTGEMWTAIRNARKLVKPGGKLFIAIYNKVEYDTLTGYRGSHGWLRLKRLYNRSGWFIKRTLESGLAAKDVFAHLVTLRNPLRLRRYCEKRGMSWWSDIVDWVGGYPFEFASAGEIFEFCHRQLGLELERMTTTTSIGCNQFLFSSPLATNGSEPPVAAKLQES
jgi:2-polyprenyl-3-methyl-5-hydroxy-6-metoxy-1,4-benzoquinol methylase